MAAGSDRLCKDCGTTLTSENSYAKAGYICKQCTIDRTKKHKKEHQPKWQALLKELKGECCAMCGYNRHQAALHYHHVFPGEKTMTISHYVKDMAYNDENIDVLLNELRRVVLLCANCHAEIHSNSGQL